MNDGYLRLGYPPSKADLDAGRSFGRPNPAQAAFERLSNQVQVLVAGFGTGKSTAGARKTLASSLKNPGSLTMCVAPSYRHTEIQARKILDLIEAAKAVDGIDLLAGRPRMSRGQGCIALSCGTRIEFFTAQNRTSWMGPDAATVWFDEAEWAEEAETALDSLIHRLRESTVPGLKRIVELRLYITSTAQYLTGLLKQKIEDAQRQHAKAVAAAAAGERYVPTVGAVVAPSTCAIGYGLDIERVRLWASQMEITAFRRAVLCDLAAPPEVVFGAHARADLYPIGNLIQWQFLQEAPSFFFVDWGIQRPHVIFAQYSAALNALVLFEEWGPEGSSVADTVQAMARIALKYKLIDRNGRHVGGRRFIVIGDPTTNPGVSLRSPTEQHVLALDGQAAVQALGWRYDPPVHPRERSKHLQVQFLRQLLAPRSGLPRLLVHRQLADERDRMNSAKQTRRGIWWAMTDGLRYERDAAGRVVERVKKDGFADHAFDATAYGAVKVMGRDFWTLANTESGLLSGAGAWTHAA